MTHSSLFFVINFVVFKLKEKCYDNNKKMGEGKCFMRNLRNVSVKMIEMGILIRWDALSLVGLVSIYASTDAAALPEPERNIAQVPMMNGQFLWMPEDRMQRYYFWLLPDNGKPVQVAQRILPTEGIVNFRDLGGYPTLDGRFVRWGVLYRSGAHDCLTEKDCALLRQIGLRTVLDYRSAAEQQQCPDRQLEEIQYISLPILADAGVANILSLQAAGSAEEAQQMLQEINRRMVHDQQAQQGYAAMLRTCLQAETIPMVQHCTAGKDRVGVGVAILLLLLGVDEETVLDDYLLSNDCRLSFDKLEQVSGACLSETQRETFAALTMAQFSYLSAFIETLKVAYGTAERYALEALELTATELAQLRQMYLYQV